MLCVMPKLLQKLILKFGVPHWQGSYENLFGLSSNTVIQLLHLCKLMLEVIAFSLDAYTPKPICVNCFMAQQALPWHMFIALNIMTSLVDFSCNVECTNSNMLKVNR
jgi:hypothetical protein